MNTHVHAQSERGFYALSFGAQLIVWAVRRRLEMLNGGEDDAIVVEAFERAGLDGVYVAVTALVDVLLCGSSRALTMHATACPCLGRHEIALVETLQCLQDGRSSRAAEALGPLLCPAAQRLVMPCLQGIAATFKANGMAVRTGATPAVAPDALPPRAPTATLH